MKRNLGIFGLTMLLVCLSTPAVSYSQEYEPVVGQAGKDVVWVPTPDELIATMLDMAKVTPNDYVIDLGSGDGRIVIAAAKRGARATGIEFNPDMANLARHNAEKEGVSEKAKFINADIFESDFSQATVLTMYLLPHLNMKLRPTILDMKPGTRVVTHAFTMEDWEADQSETANGRSAYLWIVPAKVAGTWTWQEASGKVALNLNQTFQKIDGTLLINNEELPIENASLRGDRISFTISEGNPRKKAYEGRINGKAIDGVIKAANGRELKWTAAHE